MKLYRHIALALHLVVSGCAITNQGSVDYRFERPGSANDALASKYISTAAASNPLKSGDPITITLKQVYINQLTEFRSPLRYVRLEPTTGDVAIIASACESPCERKFGAQGLRNSKVIYYSNDVRERQFLNLSNLQGIYGPITYTGNPFKIDIYMIELDESGPQIKQLLGSLATLGQTFYPPAHPAATVLTTLADSFIGDDQDDNIFTFSFDLVAHRIDGNTNSPATAFLEAGHYILIRSEDREQLVQWAKLGLNSPTGRVVYRKDNCINSIEPDVGCYFTENSYVVLEVNRTTSAIANDVQQALYSSFHDKLAQPSTGASLSTEKIEILKTELISLEVRNQAISALSRIEISAPGSAQRKSASLSFITLWSDLEKSVVAQDKNTVAERLNLILASCTELSERQLVAYYDQIKSRAFADKSEILRDLNTCNIR